jgi:SOS-response transcriptional repressor LexA
MDKKGESHHDFFLDRLCDAVERHVGVNKHDHGFKIALAKALNARASTVQRWFKDSYPESKYLIKIFETFGATPNFLLGIESKSKPERFPVPILELVDFVQIEKPMKKEDFLTVPLVAGSIAAGRTIIVDENIEDWVVIHKNIKPKTKNLVAIRIDKKEGMSMYPILKPNDIVIIDRDDMTITPHGIFAIRIDDGCTIKRLQKSDETLLLIPENKEYKTQIIDLKAHPHPIIGRVIWCSKTL